MYDAVAVVKGQRAKYIAEKTLAVVEKYHKDSLPPPSQENLESKLLILRFTLILIYANHHPHVELYLLPYAHSGTHARGKCLLTSYGRESIMQISCVQDSLQVLYTYRSPTNTTSNRCIYMQTYKTIQKDIYFFFYQRKKPEDILQPRLMSTQNLVPLMYKFLGRFKK